MLFKRREREGFWERTRTAVWPRRSFSRSVQYLVKRILRLTASPHAIAAGVAAGAFASFTPLLGFHFILAAIIAFILAGNLVASAIGTFVGNPITFPFIWGFTHKLGTFMLGSRYYEGDRDINLFQYFRHTDFWELWDIWDLIMRLWHPFMKPMLVGSIPLGIFCGAFFYIVTFWAVKAFQNRRRAIASKKASVDLV